MTGTRAWLLILLVLVLDVVTLFFPLFGPRVRWFTIAVLTGILLFFVWLRWMDWRMQRRHAREAFAALAADGYERSGTARRNQR